MNPDEIKELLRIRESIEARLDAQIAPHAVTPPWVADQANYHPETATVAGVTSELQTANPSMWVAVTEFNGLFTITVGPAKE